MKKIFSFLVFVALAAFLAAPAWAQEEWNGWSGGHSNSFLKQDIFAGMFKDSCKDCKESSGFFLGSKQSGKSGASGYGGYQMNIPIPDDANAFNSAGYNGDLEANFEPVEGLEMKLKSKVWGESFSEVIAPR